MKILIRFVLAGLFLSTLCIKAFADNTGDVTQMINMSLEDLMNTKVTSAGSIRPGNVLSGRSFAEYGGSVQDNRDFCRFRLILFFYKNRLQRIRWGGIDEQINFCKYVYFI